MSKVIKIKKGLDIKLKGAAEKVTVQAGNASVYAIKPPDFVGLTPKLKAKPGDEVQIGSPVLFDKSHPEVFFTSPVSGVVKEVVRGERRKILEVLIEANGEEDHVHFTSGDPAGMEAGTIKEVLLQSGLWPALVERPYGRLANPQAEPKGIFISGFDSGPLGVDYEMILKDQEQAFASGIAALQKLTPGSVHLSLRAGDPVVKAMADLKGVEYHLFSGPHPSGLVGIQIHHISPINKGEVVWTIKPHHVAMIGNLFLNGRLDPSVIVALAGSKVSKPRYMKTRMGTCVAPLLQDQLIGDPAEARVISGNALTGSRIAADGYLGFYDALVSVIPEGNYYELFGWATPGLSKFSHTRAFFSWLRPGKEWDIDTNLKGGPRAFVMTGQYDKVLPMDVLPVFLLKAILVNDIDRMEQLGIYEVIEEDMALCEFVCTSKTEVQSILRQGLDTMYKEMN